MLSTEQSVPIRVPLGDVWTYVSAPSNWAEQFPGYESFEEKVPDSEYIWTVKIGLGGLVRTVKVRVHVTAWDEPHHVSFGLKGITEPITGQGAFDARPAGVALTDVTLTLSIAGSGNMANMMEAMARPVVPKLGQLFCNRLKDEIESRAGVVEAATTRVAWYARVWSAIRSLFRRPARMSP